MVNGDGVIGRFERCQIPGANPGLDGRLDEPCDGAELDLAGDEGRDRYLVRRIEYSSCTPTGP